MSAPVAGDQNRMASAPRGVHDFILHGVPGPRACRLAERIMVIVERIMFIIPPFFPDEMDGTKVETEGTKVEIVSSATHHFVRTYPAL